MTKSARKSHCACGGCGCGICLLHAGLNCLLQFFGVPESVLHVQQRPSLVLSAEAELGITAGLQDRVIQVGRHCRTACVAAACRHAVSTASAHVDKRGERGGGLPLRTLPLC